jgi:hypothetical protein
MSLAQSTSSCPTGHSGHSTPPSPIHLGTALPPTPALTASLARLVRGEQEAPERVALRGTDSYRLTPLEFGRATEARFAFDAACRGLLVSRPFDSLPSYDALVDNGVRVFKVQIKGVNPSRGINSVRYRRPQYYVSLWSYGRKRPPRFDICAIYLTGHARWMFLDASYRSRHTLGFGADNPLAQVGWEIFQARE